MIDNILRERDISWNEAKLMARWMKRQMNGKVNGIEDDEIILYTDCNNRDVTQQMYGIRVYDYK